MSTRVSSRNTTYICTPRPVRCSYAAPLPCAPQASVRVLGQCDSQRDGARTGAGAVVPPHRRTHVVSCFTLAELQHQVLKCPRRALLLLGTSPQLGLRTGQGERGRGVGGGGSSAPRCITIPAFLLDCHFLFMSHWLFLAGSCIFVPCVWPVAIELCALPVCGRWPVSCVTYLCVVEGLTCVLRCRWI